LFKRVHNFGRVHESKGPNFRSVCLKQTTLERITPDFSMSAIRHLPRTESEMASQRHIYSSRRSKGRAVKWPSSQDQLLNHIHLSSHWYWYCYWYCFRNFGLQSCVIKQTTMYAIRAWFKYNTALSAVVLARSAYSLIHCSSAVYSHVY